MMQRKQLDAVHQDSARELGFAARTRVEELNLARLTNNSLLDAYWKVGKADETASEIEIHKFITLMRLSYLQLINSWNLGVNEKNVEFYKFLRSLESYKKSLDKNTEIVLSPKSGFLENTHFSLPLPTKHFSLAIQGREKASQSTTKVPRKLFDLWLHHQIMAIIYFGSQRLV